MKQLIIKTIHFGVILFFWALGFLGTFTAKGTAISTTLGVLVAVLLYETWGKKQLQDATN